jgi:hypothetical protein
MKSWYKIVIPVVIVAVAAGGYLIFSKPKTATHPLNDNQVQEVNETASDNISVAQETAFAKTPDVVISKENLHKSDVPLPDKDMVKKVQAELFKDVKKEDLEKAKKTVHELHMYFESGFVYEAENWIKKYSDPNSPGWVFWEKTGTIEIPGYTEKVYNEKDGNWYIQKLEEAKKVFTGKTICDDIAKAQDLISIAVKNHDIKNFWYAHQVLHDLDYWVLNYPIQYPKGTAAPPDWKGVETYFGVTKTLKGFYQTALEGYIYDEQTGRYINKITGVWYVVKDGYKVIPPEEYIDRAKVETIDGINITDRPNDVWELKEVRKITIQAGDTLVDIIKPYFMNEHFRMNYEWYAKQVLKLNNITDPHYIKAGDTLKIPIYIDKRTK